MTGIMARNNNTKLWHLIDWDKVSVETCARVRIRGTIQSRYMAIIRPDDNIIDSTPTRTKNRDNLHTCVCAELLEMRCIIDLIDNVDVLSWSESVNPHLACQSIISIDSSVCERERNVCPKGMKQFVLVNRRHQSTDDHECFKLIKIIGLDKHDV